MRFASTRFLCLMGGIIELRNLAPHLARFRHQAAI
jgi:hypothetical protein